VIPLKPRHRETPLPDLTPMLDTVFILLFFFVIAAAVAIHGVDLRLPKSSAASSYAGHPMEILLSADGTLRHNEKSVTLRDLAFLVRDNTKGEGNNRQILLVPDRNATVGDFMATVGAIRDNGGDRLVIAAEPTSAATLDKP
jgi:biopolymer transport protein ExbD